MNPTVLICTHERLSVTLKNLESLHKQSFIPKIVLVTSDTRESYVFKEKFPEIKTVEYPNYPLGSKWQRGVDEIRSMGDADPLIITGSDDILGTDFIINACAYMQDGYDFIGLYYWHILHQKTLYKFHYNNRLPLGGGRVYSQKALKLLNYKIFDNGRDRHLDDFAWNQIVRADLKKLLLDQEKDVGLNIVSIKGDWPVMNSFDRIMRSNNCRLMSQSRIEGEIKKLINIEI